jgi:DsbC/DsbD-like thiol-disulfide interchange protein
MKKFAALAALGMLTLIPGPTPAQVKKSDNVAKVSATADKPDADGNQTVTITINVEKPWHLYANPVGNDMLTAAQTSVKFNTKTEDVKFTYPAGKLVKDDTVGNYRTFEGSFVIKATVRRTKGDTSPLEMTVKFQACDEKTCLLPARVKITAK